MDTVFAQAVGIAAMVICILAFQLKTAKGIVLMQAAGALLFVANFGLLGQYAGALLNAVGCVRAVLLMKKEKWNTDSNLWLAILGVAYIACYVLTFAVFGEEFTLRNAVIQCLPVLGMFCSHLAFRSEEAAQVRKIFLASSVCWIIYNAIGFSIGGILCEAFNIVSIFIAMARLDRKTKERVE